MGACMSAPPAPAPGSSPATPRRSSAANPKSRRRSLSNPADSASDSVSSWLSRTDPATVEREEPDPADDSVLHRAIADRSKSTVGRSIVALEQADVRAQMLPPVKACVRIEGQDGQGNGLTRVKSGMDFFEGINTAAVLSDRAVPMPRVRSKVAGSTAVSDVTSVTSVDEGSSAQSSDSNFSLVRVEGESPERGLRKPVPRVRTLSKAMDTPLPEAKVLQPL